MAATVDIIIPVYNEEQALPRSIRILSDFLKANLSNPWQVVIADNASTDGTRRVAEQMARQYAGVHYLYLPQKGRGRALRTAWLESTADILCYMDVDLSTNLVHLPEVIQAVESGYDIAIGSRLSPGSRVTRSLKREVISRAYNLLIRAMFFTSFQDAQCGFKAITRQAARAIIPHVKNNNWFFDTELLIIAAKRGYHIKPIPVGWLDDPTSTVRIVRTAWEDIKGLLRLRLGGVPRVALPAHAAASVDPAGEAARTP
jgi:glycosyltransferase involved in cell wall biosynthesis